MYFLQLISTTNYTPISILCKLTRDPKKKCTQLLKTVIHALSHGVINFVRTNGFKSKKEASDWLLENFDQ